MQAGISAGDAIVTTLTGANRNVRDHAAAARELRTALGKRAAAGSAENALRELISAKSDVECGTALVTPAKSGPLVRRAWLLVELAV